VCVCVCVRASEDLSQSRPTDRVFFSAAVAVCGLPVGHADSAAAVRALRA